jgi:hypothetical protein
MRKQILAISCAMLFPCGVLCRGQQALRSNIKIPTAGVRGRITIDEVVGHAVQSNPIPKLKLYLLRADDTQPLVQLQERCRRATADANANPLRAFRTCDDGLRQAVNLVPTLPSVATTETDRYGQYEFPEVPAAGRYNVVAVKTVEGAEPLVMVGITNKLQAGDRITLNFSANDPWTRAVTP